MLFFFFLDHFGISGVHRSQLMCLEVLGSWFARGLRGIYFDIALLGIGEKVKGAAMYKEQFGPFQLGFAQLIEKTRQVMNMLSWMEKALHVSVRHSLRVRVDQSYPPHMIYMGDERHLSNH